MVRYAIISILLSAALAGCAAPRDDATWQSDCVAAGHAPGTPEFADCLSQRQAEFEEECLSAVATCH